MADNFRHVMIFTGDGWIEKEFIDVKKGDIFSIYEPDDTLVVDDGVSEFIATKDGYYNLEGIMVVEYEEA